MRGFVVVLVVLHHAALAYCTFGHVDRANYSRSTAPIVDVHRWIGFDLVVLLNDGFFMPLLFMLSGLFVWSGLIRRGAPAFLDARVRRLGVPFAVAVLTVIPLAYYPSFLQSGGVAGLGRFWVQTITTGPWPSGPPWFIGVLLVFDAGAALAFLLAMRCRAVTPARQSRLRPGSAFAMLLAGSCLLYLPLLLAVGPTRWLGVGPLAIQGSRIGLYATYFAVGVALGRSSTPALVTFARALAERWASWCLLAMLVGTTFIVVYALVARGGLELPAPAALAAVGTTRSVFCAMMAFALPALFLRFAGHASPLVDSLAANSFGIYLLHYPFVTWVQYGLVPVHADALVKGAATFVVALLASWVSTSLLRSVPIAGRFL